MTSSLKKLKIFYFNHGILDETLEFYLIQNQFK